MEMNLKTINKRTVLMITLATFLVIILILAAISFVMQKSAIDNESDFSSVSSHSESSAILSEEIAIEDDASQTFAESVFDESEFGEDESFEVIEEIEHGWIKNEYGYTYVYLDSGYEQFNFSDYTLNRYAESLNNIVEYIPENTRIFNLIVPVSSTFASIPREIYREDEFFNKSQSAFVSTVSTKLNEKIVNIPLVQLFEERYENGEYLFFRTDKNWTSVGAYNAYKAFCEYAGINAYSLSSFSKTEVGDYLGSFYRATKRTAMENNPDDLVCYSTVPSVKTSLTVYDSGIVYTDYVLCRNSVTKNDAYNVFLGTVAGRYEINTTVDGGSLLVIGDSSSYPLIPFLASHYSKVDVIDPQYFDTTIETFLSNHHYDDIITMCYSTNAINGDYIPSFNIFTGVTINE